MRTVFACGNTLYGLGSSELGSYSNAMVSSLGRSGREVAA